MIKLEVDMQKLNRTLMKSAKAFGDTTKAAVVRWGVNTSRQLAVSTQPFGVGGTAKKQKNAIEAGMRAVVRPIGAREMKRAKGNVLNSASEINGWIESHRGKRGRTALNGDKRAVCKKSDFTSVLRERKMRAGMAKGAWLGAARDIAKRQRGRDRVVVGQSFLKWTQRHADKGTAKQRGTMWKPYADMINKAGHVKSSYVLRDSEKRKAVEKGGRRTRSWYRSALRARMKMS